MKNKIYLIVYLSVCTALIGCAPKVQEREFKPAKVDFTVDERDTNLHLRVREFGEAPPSLVWQADVATSEFLQQSENVSAIGQSIGNQALTDKVVSWLDKFYQSEKVARVDFSDTPFTGLVTTQTQLQVRPALEQVLADIQAARPIIQEHIMALKVEPPTATMSLDEILNRAEEFGEKVVQEIPRMKLSQVIEDGLSIEMVNTMKPMFADARSFLNRFAETKTLSQSLALIDEAVVKFEMELPPDLQKSMKQGKGLAKGLDRMEDEQGALTVLVDVWRMLTSEERTQIMKPGNEELYNFLRKQNDDELDCLRTPGCLGGPIDGVVKKLFILPKIRKYGVTLLKREMNTKTRDYVISSIQTFAHDFILKMPQTFVESIDAGIVTKAGKIANVRDNYEAYVKDVMGTWSKKIMPQSLGTIPGFEPLKVILQVEKNERLKISPHSAYSELTGDLVGPSLAAQVLFLENKSMELQSGREFTLSALNKLIAMTGYRKADGTLAPALLAPVDHKGKLLDIVDFDGTEGPETSFRIPDSVQVSAHFHFEPEQKYAKNFSASNFATQLHGLNQFLRLTRDWETTKFDKYLGGIQVQEVTDDAQDPALKQALFPKDMLFALNLGAAAVLFQDLTKRATPVFLYTLEGPLMWADQYGSSPNNAVMAGIVDIQDGKRGLKVDAASLSQLILASSEFLEVTKDAEQTKSSILLEKPEGGGERPLDSLIQGQKDLKLLVIALSNLLSNKMITADKLVAPRFDYVKVSDQTVGGYKIKDQALAIRALLAAYKLTGIDAYLWSAQGIYFAMNKQMFNLKKEFYVSQGAEQAEFTETVEMLRSLMELRVYLPAASVPQLDRVVRPWIESLKVLP